MERFKGIVMIILGSMLWGAVGPMMEWLLANTTMTSEFMLAVRLLIAGIFILGLLRIQNNAIFAIWKNRYFATQLFIFSMLGISLLYICYLLLLQVQALPLL